MTGCGECAIRKRAVSLAVAELHQCKRAAHRTDVNLRDALLDRKARVFAAEERLIDHQAECEIANAPTPEPVHTERKAKVDGRIPCPVCRRPQRPLPTGFLRKHVDPDGYPCSNRDSGVRPSP